MTTDARALRVRWETAELPVALFDAAEALVWALDRREDPLAWAIALTSLLDRREGSTWTPLTRAHFADRLAGVFAEPELDAIATGFDAAATALWDEAPIGATPWVRDRGAIAARRLHAWEAAVESWAAVAASGPSTGPTTAAETTSELGRLTAAQRDAVRTAVGRRLTAITGGPGTGKTTVIAALARTLVACGIPREGILMAAPTGKAAHRLQVALHERGPHDLPAAETLHRLLGYRPGTDEFEAGPGRPLSVDAIIVDEASMLDLRLAAQLVSALPPTAQLVLVGDPDQLPPVDAGAVFRDLVDAYPSCVARLDDNLRVVASEGGRALANFADALRRGVAEPPPAREELPDPGAEGVFGLRRSNSPHAARRAWHRWIEAARPDAPGASAEMILTLVREGPHGSEAANRETSARRAARGGATGWARGQPVMVTRNLTSRGLFNGDLGVVEAGPESGEPAVCFHDGVGGRTFDLASLRTHLVGADALTVHKAQGSEFDRVMVWLPDAPHPLLSRELLYTAVTRARRQVVIAGPADAFRFAQDRTIRRRTGTRAR